MEDDCQEIKDLVVELDQITCEEIYQMLKEANERQVEIEDFDLVSDEMDHSTDVITIAILEPHICSSENKSTDLMLLHEDLPVEVPYIDFIIGDERRMVKVCGPKMRVLQLKHLVVRSISQSESSHKEKQGLKFTWSKSSLEVFKTCKDYEDQQEQWKLVRWVFDRGRYL